MMINHILNHIRIMKTSYDDKYSVVHYQFNHYFNPDAWENAISIPTHGKPLFQFRRLKNHFFDCCMKLNAMTNFFETVSFELHHYRQQLLSQLLKHILLPSMSVLVMTKVKQLVKNPILIRE